MSPDVPLAEDVALGVAGDRWFLATRIKELTGGLFLQVITKTGSKSSQDGPASTIFRPTARAALIFAAGPAPLGENERAGQTSCQYVLVARLPCCFPGL
jgi:hypothetical protein